MKHIPILRTRRITVQLKELSIGDSIALASMPAHLEQAECGAFLRYVISEVVHGEKDPGKWTVPERNLVVAHYLAAMLEDGPDFSLSESSKYSDYLDASADIKPNIAPLHISEVGDDKWTINHLTGDMAETIERLEGEIDGINPQTHWRFGAMAAQLVRKGEEIPEISSHGHYDEWLLARMRVFMAFPSTDFEQLMVDFYIGREKLHHLFNYDFGIDGGILIEPKNGGAGDIPPARFPVRAALSELAESMAGKPRESGREP